MKTTKMQFPLFTQPTEWVPPSDLPDLRDATQLCIDIETRDPNIKKKGPGWPTMDGEIIGYAVAVDGWSGYMPVAHHGGGNLDKRIVTRWLQKQLAAPSDKIMHNAQYDLGWLRAAGFEVNGRIIDTMVTANLIDENRFSYSLNALGYDYLGKTKSEKGLVEAKAPEPSTGCGMMTTLQLVATVAAASDAVWVLGMHMVAAACI